MKKNIDQENLLGVIKESPDQLLVGIKLAQNVTFRKRFNGFCLHGMGGSALAAELIDLFLTEENLKDKFTVLINRNYELPQTNRKNNFLHIFSSYSGNTEETLTALQKAIKLKLPILVLTSGGKLEKIAVKNGFPLIKIPAGIQPRMALGYSFGALLKVLEKLRVLKINGQEIAETINRLHRNFKTFDTYAQGLAKNIITKTPVIYASANWKALAMIWKIMLNENGKTPAFWNYFPELNHNEMVGFTKSKADFFLFLLRASNDHPRNLKRYSLTAGLLKKSKIASEIIDIPKGKSIYTIFATLQIGSLLSYYSALNNGEDPTPVKMVEEFKQKMAN